MLTSPFSLPIAHNLLSGDQAIAQAGVPFTESARQKICSPSARHTL
jgi:hypothetical protein